MLLWALIASQVAPTMLCMKAEVEGQAAPRCMCSAETDRVSCLLYITQYSLAALPDCLCPLGAGAAGGRSCPRVPGICCDHAVHGRRV